MPRPNLSTRNARFHWFCLTLPWGSRDLNCIVSNLPAWHLEPTLPTHNCNSELYAKRLTHLVERPYTPALNLPILPPRPAHTIEALRIWKALGVYSAISQILGAITAYHNSIFDPTLPKAETQNPNSPETLRSTSQTSLKPNMILGSPAQLLGALEGASRGPCCLGRGVLGFRFKL